MSFGSQGGRRLEHYTLNPHLDSLCDPPFSFLFPESLIYVVSHVVNLHESVKIQFGPLLDGSNSLKLGPSRRGPDCTGLRIAWGGCCPWPCSRHCFCTIPSFRGVLAQTLFSCILGESAAAAVPQDSAPTRFLLLCYCKGSRRKWALSAFSSLGRCARGFR